MSGLRVELEVESPTAYPIGEAATEADAGTTAVPWSRSVDAPVEHSEVDGHADGFASDGPTGGVGASTTSPLSRGVEPIFAHEDDTASEFERDDGTAACECLPDATISIADVRPVDDTRRVTLHLDDGTGLGELLETVGVAEDVSIRRVARSSSGDGSPGELVPVDRGRLTDRQLDVLETAHAMGYYDYPRGANATEVADALDICPSTLAEHLAAAQTKLLDDVLGERE